MTAATTVDCPLCPVTVLGQGADEVTAVARAIGALEDHITEHHTPKEA